MTIQSLSFTLLLWNSFSCSEEIPSLYEERNARILVSFGTFSPEMIWQEVEVSSLSSGSTGAAEEVQFRSEQIMGL